MDRVWRSRVLMLTMLVVILATASFAGHDFELEPGVYTFCVNSQHFEIETEVTILLSFDFIDEIRVVGSVEVLDAVGAGWVRLTWLEHSAVIIDQIVDGYEVFDYTSCETGHAERTSVPKFGPTMPVKPIAD